jgi:hypothetical protein
MEGKESVERSTSPPRGRSPGRSPMKGSPEKNLAEINAQLAEIRKKRQDLSVHRMEPFNSPNPNRDILKAPKKVYHHPNFEYIVGQITSSPYLTNPLKKYPDQTFTVIEEVRKLKQQGIKYKDLKKEQVPFDYPSAKETFTKEIINFHPSFARLRSNAWVSRSLFFLLLEMKNLI